MKGKNGSDYSGPRARLIKRNSTKPACRRSRASFQRNSIGQMSSSSHIRGTFAKREQWLVGAAGKTPAARASAGVFAGTSQMDKDMPAFAPEVHPAFVERLCRHRHSPRADRRDLYANGTDPRRAQRSILPGQKSWNKGKPKPTPITGTRQRPIQAGKPRPYNSRALGSETDPEAMSRSKFRPSKIPTTGHRPDLCKKHRYLWKQANTAPISARSNVLKCLSCRSHDCDSEQLGAGGARLALPLKRQKLVRTIDAAPDASKSRQILAIRQSSTFCAPQHQQQLTKRHHDPRTVKRSCPKAKLISIERRRILP